MFVGRKQGVELKKSNLFLILFLIFISLTEKVAYSAQGDTYSFSWLDPDKEVFVLQNRKYFKKNRLYINGGGGIKTNGAFVDSYFFQGRIGYFFLEDWGLEGLYVKHKGEESDAAKSVRKRTIPFRRLIQSYQGGMLLWSPFYAKVNTFNNIIYLDWMIGIGGAQLTEDNNVLSLQSSAIDRRITTETHQGLLWDTSLKFFINRHWEIRTGLTVFHYKAEEPTDEGKESWDSNWDVHLSLGLIF